MSSIVCTSILLLLASCSPNGASKSQITFPLIGTTWIIESVNDELLETQVFIKLDEENRLTGFAGCNRFFSNFIVGEDQLEFGLAGSTKMMCPDMETEKLIFSVIDRTRAYKIKEDNLLLLNEKKELLAKAYAQETDQ